MAGAPLRCGFCNSPLDPKVDIGDYRTSLMGGVYVIWCRKCGAVLGGNVSKL